MKLYELQIGDRFEFADKNHGRVFEVTAKETHLIGYRELATGQDRQTTSIRKTFRMDVILSTPDDLKLSRPEFDLLLECLTSHYEYCCEQGEQVQYSKGADINALFAKFKRYENKLVR